MVEQSIFHIYSRRARNSFKVTSVSWIQGSR